MSEIPPLSIHPTAAEQLNVSQENRSSENDNHPKRIPTNVTLNPRDSALDSLPSIHWSDLPKAPPNYLKNMDGVEKSNADGQGMVMGTSNRNANDARNINNHEGRGVAPSHQEPSVGHNQTVRPTNSSIKSFRNTSNDEYSPPPSRTPPYKSGMPGYQPISPYPKRKHDKVEKSVSERIASGRTFLVFLLKPLEIISNNNFH